MEPLNIPHLADETLIGGSFQTPILEDVTYGQRDNSRNKKNVNIRIFQKKLPFKKPLGMYTLGEVCILTNAKLIRRLPLGAHSTL